jgi:predicted solute-binding protein
MEEFINPTDLTKSEMKEINEKMKKIVEVAEKEWKRELEGFMEVDEKTYQDEKMKEHVQDNYMTNGNYSTRERIGGIPEYNQKGPLAQERTELYQKRSLQLPKL